MVVFIELSDAATRCPCFLMTGPEQGICQDAATRARIWGSCCREILTASASSSLMTLQLAESVVLNVELGERVLVTNGDGVIHLPFLLWFCGGSGGDETKLSHLYLQALFL